VRVRAEVSLVCVTTILMTERVGFEVHNGWLVKAEGGELAKDRASEIVHLNHL